FLAQHLPKSIVLNQDATNIEFLKTEGIARAKIVVSALQPDERNLFASLQAMHLGAERVVSVVHEGKHQSLFEAFGVEVTFNPRKEVIEEIIRHTRGRRLEKVAFVEHHQGEVIEVKLTKDSPLVARLLEEAILDFPAEMVIGAVSRNGKIIIPGGKTILKTGDDLVIFLDTKVVDEVVSKI
ncbi:MAG: NAD-binding protein, partial [Bradymonadaceae bacterium]